MHFMEGAKLLRKDQARRLKYQEKQRIISKTGVQQVKPFDYMPKGLLEGQLKAFASKLVK